MEYVIAKAFKTLIHRFNVGDPVNRTYDLQPYRFDELVERGDIVEKVDESSEHLASSEEPAHFESPSRIGRDDA